MGNSNPSYLKLLTTIEHPERWQIVGRELTYDILENSKTLYQIYQSYIDVDSGYNHESIMQEYMFRRTQNLNIVKVIFAYKMSASYICVANTKYRVWTERIPFRLSYVKNLQEIDTLEILRYAISGFYAAYQYGKRTYITDEMIGFTYDGNVRIWVNSNFADNRSEYQVMRSRERPLELLESQVVHQLIQTIRYHTYKSVFNYKLYNRIGRELTFKYARRIITDYATYNSIILRGQINLDRFRPINNLRDPKVYNLSEVSFGVKQESKISTTDTNRSAAISTLPILNNLHKNAVSRPVYQNKNPYSVPSINVAKQKIAKMQQTTCQSTVASLQNKALFLKQQTNPLTNSKKNVNIYPLYNSHHHEPRKENILVQNRESPPYTYIHKAPNLVDSPRGTQMRSISLNNLPQYQMLTVKSRPITNQNNDLIHVRENKSTERNTRTIQFNQNSHKVKAAPIRALSPTGGLPHHRHQSAERTPSTKMDFSFDPKISPKHIPSARTALPTPVVEFKIYPYFSMQSSINSRNVLTNSQNRMQGSGHGRIESFYTHFPNIAMTQTIHLNSNSKKDEEPDEYKFLEYKIKEIYEQLKHITYLESSRGSGPLRYPNYQNHKETSLEKSQSRAPIK